MTFSEGGSFGGGRVRTSRGGGGRRGGAVGGGIGAIVVLVGALFFGVDLSPVVNGVSGAGGPGGGSPVEQGTIGECTAEQANTTRECRLSATVDALDTYWGQTLPALGVQYAQPDVWSFEDAVDTGCGPATSATGPFYCPPDQSVYLDLGFYDELTTRFGASGGALAEMYVLAHEFGHHIEQLTGMMDAAERGGTGPESDSVRIELAADCMAGMVIGNLARTVDPDTGVTYIDPPTPEQVADALSAASAVGDDRIQEQATGTVNPEAWTHGSSEQRQRWFTIGYDGGTFQDCDALQAPRL
ncbi:KPN_02809 family neutral zinc metallopeptidase [Cellulomonas aerilata]|uniref:Membrane protein n=1 Tax=Cellulomonas aerilata TaxID=515326 RepID=A0A512DFS6_9CELL|nr:neutral zinc metallopeptidase [Cellulomonas aerilata]GEO35343.1 membrane protein [Cellulomonas aerilata]